MKKPSQPIKIVTTGATALAVAGVATVMTTKPVAAATVPATQASTQPAPVSSQAADYQRGMAAASASAQAALSAAANSYSQAVSAQTRANQAAESSQANANAVTWQRALNGTTPASQQVAKDQAASAHDQALSQAQSDYQREAESVAASRDQAQQAAQAQLNQGVATLNAGQVTSVKPAVGIDQVAALSQTGPKYMLGSQPSYNPALYLGRYQSVKADWFKDAAEVNAARVSSEDQLPLNFVPGLLIYDASADTSARIGAAGLTAAQKATLNDLSNQWMNSLRTYYYKTMRGNLMEDGLSPVVSQDGMVQPATLKTEQDFWNVTQDLARLRENEGWSYDHTTTEYGSVNYYDVVRQAMGIEGGVWCAENLYTLAGGTMVEFEVNLYNRMQAMLYNELVQTANGSFADSIGHLQNALNPEFSEAAMGFQRVKDVNGQVAYNVIWEFMGTAASNGLDSIAPQMAGGRQTVQTPMGSRRSVGGWLESGVVNRIDQAQNAGKDAQATRNARQQALNQAYQTAVKQATENYQTQLTQLQAQLKNRQTAADQAYQQRLTEIENQATATSQLRAQLDASLASVKAKGADQLARLQKNYENQTTAIQASLNDRQAALARELTASQVTPSAASDRPRVIPVGDQLALVNGAIQDGVTMVTLPGTPTAGSPAEAPVTPQAKQDPVAADSVTAVRPAPVTSTAAAVAQPAGKVPLAPAAPAATSKSTTPAQETRTAKQLPQTGSRSAAALTLVGLGLAGLALQWALGKKEW